jgi:hypothetical protein
MATLGHYHQQKGKKLFVTDFFEEFLFGAKVSIIHSLPDVEKVGIIPRKIYSNPAINQK